MKFTFSRKLLKGAVIFLLTALLLIFSASSGYGTETESEEETASAYPAYTHLASKSDADSPYGKGSYLYHSLKITGSAMQEEQVFNVSEIEQICLASELSLYRELQPDASSESYEGIDLKGFLTLCGMQEESDQILTIFQSDSVLPAWSCPVSEIEDSQAVIAVGKGGIPLVPSAESEGYDGDADNQGGPLAVVLKSGTVLSDVAKIMVSLPDSTEDPYYSHHDREPLNYMQSMVFTIRYLDQSEYDEQGENTEPFQTCSFTIREIEDLMKAYPEEVRGGYYGVSGNEETKTTFGLGGFSDYYEGLDLCWFLQEKAGLKNGNGKAVLYGRDLDQFGEIDDLSYFFAGKNYHSYYLEIDDDTKIEGAAPILAVSKNGSPLLPLHDHEMEGYVDYNLFHDLAAEKGWDSKVGLVKNVSGPMIAGLPNLDGIYGGYRNETSGDCIQIDLIVDRSDYESEEIESDFQDVPEESWFYEDVKELTAQGVINGMTSQLFCPSEQVTRAQFVKMLAVCSGETIDRTDRIFSDVNTDNWAAPYIEWAYRAGIVNGKGENCFCPDLPVTREEMAVMTDRYMKYRNISLIRTVASKVYADQEMISDYALQSVENLGTYGILNGREDGQFDPKSFSTRAEAAAMTARMLSKCR